MSELEWMRSIPRRIMVGMHAPDYDQLPAEYHELHKAGKVPGIFENMDVDALVSLMKDCDIQAFWCYCKGGGGNAFYPSKVGHVLSALNGHDLFGEICEKCLSAGITPLAIYETGDTRLRKDKPEWCNYPVEVLRGEAEGEGHGPCAYSEPYGDFVIEQVREVLKGYPVKAIYLDELGAHSDGGNWLSRHGYARYRKDFGYDFPGIAALDHAQYVRHIRWFINLMREYLKKVRGVVKDIRPDVAFTYNYVGFPDQADFVTCDIFPFKGGTLSLETTLRRNAVLSRYQPGEALLDVVGHGDHYSSKGMDGYEAELWTARSLGVATCTCFILPLDGRLLTEQFERSRVIYGR